MTIFICIILLIVALPFVLWPLINRKTANDPTRRALNVAAYRSRMAELEIESGIGVVPADQLDSIKEELGNRLLVDAAPEDGSELGGSLQENERHEQSHEHSTAHGDIAAEAVQPASVASVVVLSVVLLSLSLLGFVGTGGSAHLQIPFQQAALDPQNPDPAAVADMADDLRRHLTENPQDIEGWMLLARTRSSLREFAAAAEAWSQVNDLIGRGEAEWLVAEGEALAFAANRDLQGRPDELFREALQADPLSQKALWYMGLSAFQREDYETALVNWETLRGQPLPDRLAAVLDDQVAETRARLAGTSTLSGGSVDQSPAGQGARSASASVALRLRVELEPALKQTLRADQLLFVFARAASGPPMPLAAARFLASELPLSVTLTDEMAMVDGMNLSRFDQWEVVARISQDNQPQASSGDLEGQISVSRGQLPTGGEPLRLVIDKRIP